MSEASQAVAKALLPAGPGSGAAAVTEEQLRLFVEHAPASLAMLDREMCYLLTSRRWLSDMGLPERELRGVSHYELFPNIPERWREFHRRALSGEVIRAREDQFVRADGSARWINWELRPWQEAGGAVGGVMIFSEDITDRKLAELALK